MQPDDLSRQDDIHALPPYVRGLNPPQREAVETLDGPVLVLAGAGTGKTRVLVTRLTHLLRTGKAYPSQILAVTFTNKAAMEMRERVDRLLSEQGAPRGSVEGWWLGTFHALAARMLRRHAELVGLTSNFTILDPDDQIRLMKQVMERVSVDPKQYPPKTIIAEIDRWKDKGIAPSALKDADGGQAAGGKMVALYRVYQDRLRAINACDFGDLLLHMITILKDPKHQDVLDDYHRRFRYIMVDEYQDTNIAQYLWLRLLARGTGNICCVGDDDQSIYGWRGAEVGNILRFEQDFPGAKIIRLEQNYRSTGHILAAASAVITHNENRLGKTLWSDADAGEKITVRGLWDGEAEARWVGEEIESLQQKGRRLSDIAVLVRAGAQTREFEERFTKLNINYRIIGGVRFYERQEVRDALAYLRVIAQSADDLALERIINVPKRGLGDSTLQILHAFARAQSISLFDAITVLVDTDELRPKVRETLRALVGDFTRWREDLGKTPHPELAARMLEESGYMAMWQGDKSPDAPGRIENLKELVSGMAEYESLYDFLEHVALVMENQDAQGTDGVTIMTLHGAKGLEFPVVFLPGWEDGLFPSQRAMDESGLAGLEEERRLAYVGITRARERAFISHAANRRMYGQWNNALPSRFIEELPAPHIETSADTGLYAGRSSHWDSSGFGGGYGGSHPVRQAVTHKPPPTRTAPQTEGGGVIMRGARVRHDKFGTGTIVHVDGHKLDILFDVGGNKRVMDSFIELL